MLTSQQLDRQLIETLTRIGNLDLKAISKYAKDLQLIDTSNKIITNISILDYKQAAIIALSLSKILKIHSNDLLKVCKFILNEIHHNLNFVPNSHIKTNLNSSLHKENNSSTILDNNLANVISLKDLISSDHHEYYKPNAINFEFDKIDLTALEEDFLRYSSESNVQDDNMIFSIPLTPMQISSPRSISKNNFSKIQSNSSMLFQEPDLPCFELPNHNDIIIGGDDLNVSKNLPFDRSIKSKTSSSNKSKSLSVDKYTEIRSSVMRMQINNPHFLVHSFESIIIPDIIDEDSLNDSLKLLNEDIQKTFNIAAFFKLKFNLNEDYIIKDQSNSSLILRDLSRSMIENSSLIFNNYDDNIHAAKQDKINDDLTEISDFIIPHDNFIQNNDDDQLINGGLLNQTFEILYSNDCIENFKNFVKNRTQSSQPFNSFLMNFRNIELNRNQQINIRMQAALLFTYLLKELTNNDNLKCHQSDPIGEIEIILV